MQNYRIYLKDNECLNLRISDLAADSLDRWLRAASAKDKCNAPGLRHRHLFREDIVKYEKFSDNEEKYNAKIKEKNE